MELLNALDQAQQRRLNLLTKLQAEETDCWRLFHGISEGKPGLTIDRYGELILAQSFWQPLEPGEIEALEERFEQHFVYNHRSKAKVFADLHSVEGMGLEPQICRELGLKYLIRARHRGIDPHLFLDLRAGRRWVKTHARERSVLNLFAYSCGIGLAAHAGGAKEVWNVDFSASALNVGIENLQLNGFKKSEVRFVQDDVFGVIWQLGGSAIKGRRGRRKPRRRPPVYDPKQFDLIVIDPPAKAKGAYQTVDIVNDYQSLFKPCLSICATGGQILAVNNSSALTRQQFQEILRRCAEKAGRPVKSFEYLEGDGDFPSFDGEPPLKALVCEL